LSGWTGSITALSPVIRRRRRRVKLVARAHQSLIRDRSRHVLRLRAALREFFPAALEAFADLDALDTLELLGQAPDPDTAAALSQARIAAALGRANRRDAATRAAQIRVLLRAQQLRQPPPVQAAYAVVVSGQVALIRALNTQIDELGEVVASHFGRHRDADIYASQPGLGTILSARIMAEFGDDPHRFADARARKNYAGMAPITRASGRRKVVLARYARNRRLADALHQRAFCAMRGSPGAKAYYQALRARGIGHQAALRQLANRLVGILHGCLKTGTTYDEHTAWSHHQQSAA
jgi:Transposase IS116/IS110/IS902 family